MCDVDEISRAASVGQAAAEAGSVVRAGVRYDAQARMRLPRVAYLTLWFPKPSETFVFREVVGLRGLGLPLQVFSLYGTLRRDLSPAMQAAAASVERLGCRALTRLLCDLLFWLRRRPRLVLGLLRTIPFRRWRSLEVAGENLWAFLCGFSLARRGQELGLEHFHAAWANGPATAAWVASSLSGLPWSFAGRAVDIYPPDGALPEKIRAARFVVTDNTTNIRYLARHANGTGHKIHGIYNGLPLANGREAEVPMRPPYALLAMGRFDRIKAFPDLLRACRRLAGLDIDFRLTLAGDGWRRPQLQLLAWCLGLARRVRFPGWISHDRVSELYCASDLFVMSSAIHRTGERDGLPTVILEALVHRLPVVATDVCGISEVVQDGQTGRLVPPGDPAALAEAIRATLADRQQALRMAERGRALVREHFDARRNQRQLLRLFAQTPEPRP